ncbi:ligase-associated DNA damage response endonuclease PdeM [Marivirga sp. S37H4]|uniref:Ligase-associated DNA damage response endonuclease PdeM n=1 Tax=Marivirga aurantiaca TaxID=2802615 RepID=A0A934WX92_9BACT|nr:ligase-associated DNA damage response endonuclease PdeM [Marivirga aurantiaca]MBK6264803.1 ligase-associated DNA damage response endonuclease PdeM [Marivirga aurantiaca]
MQINILNEPFLLTADKVVFWEKESILFIADVHLGKTSHFRKAGIAVPNELISAEMGRIKELISKYHPKRIFFLGDLFHSHINVEWEMFKDFLREFASIEFILIKGNHDILPDTNYQLPNFKCKEEPFLFKSLLLSHHPLPQEAIVNCGNVINFAGHVHPGISIKGKGRTSLNMACYHLKQKQLILPAFGRFTGLTIQKFSQNDHYYGVTNSKVVLVKQKN